MQIQKHINSLNIISMGCGLGKQSQYTISSLNSSMKEKRISSKTDSYTLLQSMNKTIDIGYQNKLSEGIWLAVFDLLTYNDLREAGKTSK